MTPREYVADVIAGKREDPTLSFQLKNGFVVLDIIPDYLHDTESRNFATLLEWLNPQYVAAVSLHASEQQAELKEVGEEALQEALRDDRRPRRVRVAAMQYLLRPINSFEEFATQVQFFVRSAAEYGCQFVLFPEYFTMQLLSYLVELSPARAVRRLAQLTPDYERALQAARNRKPALHHRWDASRGPGRPAFQRSASLYSEWSGISPKESAFDTDGKEPLPDQPGAWLLRLPYRVRQDRDPRVL